MRLKRISIPWHLLDLLRSINDKNLNYEIETTSGILTPAALNIPINDKNLNYEIETAQSKYRCRLGPALSMIRISIMRLKLTI